MKKNKTITILFNKKIYKKKALEKTMNFFSQLANFKCVHANRYSKVTIDQIEPSFKKNLADEFSAYLLKETKKCL